MTVEYRVESFTGTTGDLLNLLNQWATDQPGHKGYRLHTALMRHSNSAGGYDYEVLLERERS